MFRANGLHLERGVCVSLQSDISLRQSWTHRVNDFSCVWDSPPLSCLPLMFVFTVGSEVTPMFDFVSVSLPPSLTLSSPSIPSSHPPRSRQRVLNSLSLSLHSACCSFVTKITRPRGWLTGFEKSSPERQEKGTETGEERRQRHGAEGEGRVRSRLCRTVVSELWRGKGRIFRGRGGWGRQRGTCWLTPEVSECLQRGSGKKQSERCS